MNNYLPRDLEKKYEKENFLKNEKIYSQFDLQKIDFYHLHIPKTGGSLLQLFLDYNFINRLKPELISLNSGHFGWRPVKDNTYIVSTIRNPITRSISHFCWMIFIKYHLTDTQANIFNRHIHGIKISIKDVYNPTPDEFMNWFLINQNVLSNYQLKNMFYDNNDTYIPKSLGGMTAQLSLTNFSIKESIDNLKKINILTKTENLNNDLLNILNKLYYDFNIDNKKIYWQPNNDKNINSNNISKILFNKIPKDYIEEIQKLNKEELEIYNTDSYFTKFDNTPQ